MLILCSNGLSSQELRTCLKERMNGCKSAVLVVTADNEYKEKNYHVSRCIEELESLGLQVDLFDLDRQVPDRLICYDVVEFIGGNPFYLLDSIRKHGALPVLQELAQRKILIGWSAAAFVFGPSLELVNSYSPEMNFLGMIDLTGLALTRQEVLPHFGKFLARFEGFEETCSAYEKKHGVSVIRLNDGEGIILENDAVSICSLEK